MANKGKFASGLTAAGDNDIYTFSNTCDFATFSLDLENGTNADMTVKVYVASSGTYAEGDRLSTFVIPADGGHAEISCKLASPNEHVVINAPVNLSYRLTGVENVAA